MSQRQQLERIMEIDRQVRSGVYPNANTLSKEMEVSRRVIFNDRDFMINRLGAPIEYDRKKGGWCYTDTTWILPNIMVSGGELLAFFLSLEIARRFLGTALEGTLRSAVDKIAKSIRGPVSVDLETLRTHYTFTVPSLTNVSEQAILDIHRAISNNQKMWMRYYTASRDEHTDRTVAPYHLYNLRGDWYLIALDDRRGEFRNFLVSRMEEWKILMDTFQRDPKFSIHEYMNTAFRAERGGEPKKVVIRFDSQQARYIRERHWHDSQEPLEELPDGGLILRFETGGLGEVQRWVMQYGSHAEVLEPESLRKAIESEAQKLAQLYNLV
jgi:predicted DNA-binding transcriptional regulator YafY